MDLLIDFVSLLELSPEFHLSWLEWALAFSAVILLGFSKAGLKGISIVIVTIMALVFGSKASTGIMVPLLVVGDIFAVIYYHRHTQWKYLLRLLPWMMLGILAGVWLGKELPEDIFKQGMAAIIILSVGMMYWWERQTTKSVPNQWWFGGIMGFLAGFCTMIGNLAGAFANIFFLAMRLPKDHFIGTAAWLFLIINVFKLPFHIWVWKTITPETLALNLRLIPAVIIGIWAGIQLIKIIKDQQYRKLILVLTGIGAILILFR